MRGDQHHARSPPIAAPAGRRATTSSSGCWSRRRRRPGASADRAAPAATTSSPMPVPLHRLHRQRLRQRRLLRPAGARRWRRPTGTASPPARRRARRRGLLRGRGIGNFLECTAPPMKEQGEIRFEADGTVTIITGTLDYGQGHWTPFAQVLHQPSRRALRGDPAGAGRQRPADRRRRHRRLQVAHGLGRRHRRGGGAGDREGQASPPAHMLEAAVGDIEFDPRRRRARPLHHRRHRPRHRHHGAGRAPPHRQQPAARRCRPTSTSGMSSTRRRRPIPTAATSARSRSTPRPAMPRWSATSSVNDFGVIVNPLLVAGQAHGGIAQGIGQALYRAGLLFRGRPAAVRQLPWTTACRAPRTCRTSASGAIPSPCTTNPLGAKGCGEAGCAGSLPAVMNALVDALSRVRHRATSTCRRRRSAIWRALNG